MQNRQKKAKNSSKEKEIINNLYIFFVFLSKLISFKMIQCNNKIILIDYVVVSVARVIGL